MRETGGKAREYRPFKFWSKKFMPDVPIWKYLLKNAGHFLFLAVAKKSCEGYGRLKRCSMFARAWSCNW